MQNRYIELFLRARPPTSKSTSFAGRGLGFSARGTSGYQTEAAESQDTSLFSRRGPTVSNSAYDGFYGTSLYKAAASGGKFHQCSLPFFNSDRKCSLVRTKETPARFLLRICTQVSVIFVMSYVSISFCRLLFTE